MSDHPTLAELDAALPFVDRHIGLRPADVATMLERLGFDSLDALMDAAVPGGIRAAADARPAAPRRARRPSPASCASIAAANRPGEAMIGLGYHATITPPVIRRNVLEDPSWYTAYTPYQPEISQGRLEALLNFQTVVGDLTGLPTANASLLDEGTAAAEAMTLVRRGEHARRPARSSSTPTRCRRPSRWSAPAPRRWASRWSSPTSPTGLPDGELCGVLVQYPGASGRILDPRAGRSTPPTSAARWPSSPPTCWRSPCSRRPATLGADVVVGSVAALRRPALLRRPARRLHGGRAPASSGTCPAAWSASRVDAEGRPAYRLALQTREQHIRRDKATSNICTAQVLLAVVASMYAVYHGPEGLRAIATPHPPLRRRPGRGAGRGRRRGRARRVLRHPDGARSPAGPPRWSPPRASAGVHLRLVDADRVGVSHLGAHHAGRRCEQVLRRVRRRRGADVDERRPGHRRRAARRSCAATTPYLDPRGVQHPPQRDRDAALPAPALGPRLRPRPRA